MTLGEYVSKVLLRMNEAPKEGISLILGSDSTRVETFIKKTMEDAWRLVVNTKASHYFPQKSFSGPLSGNMNLADGTGLIAVPADYEKFVILLMSGWKVPALEVYMNNTTVADLQSNENTRGSWIRPVVVIESDMSNMRYYSLPKNLPTHVMANGKYIPRVTIPTTDTADITVGGEVFGGDYLEMLVWLHAGIVYDIFGKTELSKICKENALSL